MIVAGFGFTSRATVDSLLGAFAAAGHLTRPDQLATAADKAATPAFVALSDTLNTPITGVDAATLQAALTTTHSPISHANRDTGSVAEAAALAAAGPGATLIIPRHISHDRMATCAIAKGADT